MAGDTPTPKNSEGNGKSSRRRSFRSKRRTRKGAADGAGREQADPTARAAAKPTPAPQSKPAPSKDSKERRRRRRSKPRGPADSRPEAVYEDNVSDLPPLRPTFIYTHVIRPAARESYEFRSDHFSKVTRRLEDFNIDLAPLWRAQEEAAKPYKLVLSDDLLAEWEDEEEWVEEPPVEATEAAAPTGEARGSGEGPSEDDPDAAIREARRRRRARRAKSKGGRAGRGDAPDALATPD